MDFITAFQNKSILIPLLQRDYVQGAYEDVISPFIDKLLRGGIELNFIYGYAEVGKFVPIDGQQRLTTLWVLYSYLFAVCGRSNELNVKLEFMAREYATDFCERLRLNLQTVVYNKPKVGILSELIKDQYWFISSWSDNTTVRNILSTLNYIEQKVCANQAEEILERLTTAAPIQFAFLEMDESKGLNDEIYIKMNGRGRPLSAFENMKSWMDERVEALPIAKEWKKQMDNAWTNLFWQNRNRQQEHSEEIDDEQLACFYNLLILYHIRYGDMMCFGHLSSQERDALYSFLGVKDGSAKDDIDDTKLKNQILNRLQSINYFPLVWLERLGLMPDGFFEQANMWLNKLEGMYNELNNLSLSDGKRLFFGGSMSETNTATYNLCMCKGTYERTLPLLFSVLSYMNGATSFKDWMRVMRNLILNSSNEKRDDVMLAIEQFAEKCAENNIYSVLQEGGAQEILRAFNKDQYNEECLKAHYVSKCYDDMLRLENGRFFAGRIKCIFDMLDIENNSEINTDVFAAYSSILLDIFNGDDGGINKQYDTSDYYFRRALISMPPYYFGLNAKGWKFCESMEEWRRYVNDSSHSLKELIKTVVYPQYNSDDAESIKKILHDYVEAISMTYEDDIKNPNDPKTYRFHFIHHPGIWGYMGSKRCKWCDDNDYDILLYRSNSNNSNRMDLRAYSLYLDYENQEMLKADYAGWRLSLYEREDSCFVFEHDIQQGGKKHTISIDVFFYDINHNKCSEDCYALTLSVRTDYHDKEADKEKVNEMNRKLNLEIFAPILSSSLGDRLKQRSDGRYFAGTYSRNGIKAFIRELLQLIASSNW